MIVLRFDPETGALLSDEQLRPTRRKRRSPEAMQRRRQKDRDRLRLKWASRQPTECSTITETSHDHV